jgi:lipoprotein-anchoring transpeptidase ErfK/SrfK
MGLTPGFHGSQLKRTAKHRRRAELGSPGWTNLDILCGARVMHHGDEMASFTSTATMILPTLTLVFASGAWAGELTLTEQPPRHGPTTRHAAAPALRCGDLVRFQVLLDRSSFSPGQIDRATSVTMRRALTAFQAARGITVTGKPDCDTWRALDGDTAAPEIVDYEITVDDAKGPFTEQIPIGLDKQADLPALDYRTILELLSERFHAAPSLLRGMNRGASFTVGTVIKVPGVTPFDATVKPVRDDSQGEIMIHVSRGDSALRATRADGTVVLFAPVTSGSTHDPLPLGDWKVTGVAWRPVFHYNPHLFWDAKPKDEKATIKAGPNNPVGIVWIALNLEHYGIHGTAEPGRVGVAESHGCVRLTNWDAARVAALVKTGTPVQFR